MLPDHISWDEIEKYHFSFYDHQKNKQSTSCYELNDATSTLTTKYFVGLGWLNAERDIQIRIRPKIESRHPSEASETDILKILELISQEKMDPFNWENLIEIYWNQPYISVSAEEDELTPFLFFHYISILRKIVNKGLKRAYYPITRNLPNRVKGKILMGQHFKENLAKGNPVHAFCQFQAFGWDHAENRLLKKALLFGARYLHGHNGSTFFKDFSSDLTYLLPAFETVGKDISVREIQNIKFNSFYKEYHEAIPLAKMILRRFGYSIQNVKGKGQIMTPPYWINMNQMFELYAFSRLKESGLGDVIFQFRGNYGSPDFLLPQQKMIADAKYKVQYAEPNLSPSRMIDDIRQLSGYGRDLKVRRRIHSEKEAPRCLIIYPDPVSGLEIDERITMDRIKTLREKPYFEKFFKIGIKLPLKEI